MKRKRRDDILKDGETLTVKMMMRDSADAWRQGMHEHFVAQGAPQLTLDTINASNPATVVDAYGGTEGLSRPGARYLLAGTRGTDHARLVTAAHLRAEAYNTYDQEMGERWRGEAHVQDAPQSVADAYRDYDLTDAEAYLKGK